MFKDGQHILALHICIITCIAHLDWFADSLSLKINQNIYWWQYLQRNTHNIMEVKVTNRTNFYCGAVITKLYQMSYFCLKKGQCFETNLYGTFACIHIYYWVCFPCVHLAKTKLLQVIKWYSFTFWNFLFPVY